MRNFYEQAIVRGSLFLLLLVAIVWCGHWASVVAHPLLPREHAILPWQLLAATDRAPTPSALTVREGFEQLDFEFSLTDSIPYSFVSVEMRFDIEPRQVADLSAYQGLRFHVSCDQPNVLVVVLRSFDAQISRASDPDRERLSTYFFNCDAEVRTISANFSQFEVADWWLTEFNLELSDTDIHQESALALAWGGSLQSPREALSHVTLSAIELIGYRWQVLAGSLALAVLLAAGFIIYLFKAHSNALRAHLGALIERDKPLVAYHKVVLEPHRDKERSAIITYIAEHYTDAELTLERLTAQVGVGRTKVNDIIKEEIGLTFTTYINKLRLAEAARLLKGNPEASISEVAFAVGYNNASYFNKLFKAEFGCTPKTYRQY